VRYAAGVIELVTFDLDDTLWDAGPVLRRADEVQYAWISAHAPKVAARYGIAELAAYRRQLAAADPALRHDFTALRHAALARLLAAHGYDPARAHDGVAEFLRARSTVQLYPEVDATLRALAAEFRLAAITNGNTDLRQAGVAHYFEFCLAPSDTGTSKPDPAMFEAACARAGVAASATVHVGDEPYHDVEGAHRAAVTAVWVNRQGRPWPPAQRRPAAEIAHLGALPAALRALARAPADGAGRGLRP